MRNLLECTDTTQAGDQSDFICTFCSTPSFEDRTYEVDLVHQDELEDYLDKYGCYEETSNALNLPLGKSLTIGFPQGSYHGLIITKIS